MVLQSFLLGPAVLFIYMVLQSYLHGATLYSLQSSLCTWPYRPLYMVLQSSLHGPAVLFTWSNSPIYKVLQSSLYGSTVLLTWSCSPLYIQYTWSYSPLDMILQSSLRVYTWSYSPLYMVLQSSLYTWPYSPLYMVLQSSLYTWPYSPLYMVLQSPSSPSESLTSSGIIFSPTISSIAPSKGPLPFFPLLSLGAETTDSSAVLCLRILLWYLILLESNFIIRGVESFSLSNHFQYPWIW